MSKVSSCVEAHLAAVILSSNPKLFLAIDLCFLLSFGVLVMLSENIKFSLNLTSVFLVLVVDVFNIDFVGLIWPWSSASSWVKLNLLVSDLIVI